MNRYTDLVGSVYPYIGGDMEKIRTVAEAADSSRSWSNPDDEKSSFAEALACEIREEDSLCGLGSLYKRLKAGTAVPETAFKSILRKMFWLSSRTEVAA